MNKWTMFVDKEVHGILATDYEFILINADKEKAISIFSSHFGFNPRETICDECGSAYTIECDQSIEQVTGYYRNCNFDRSTSIYLEETENPEYKTIEEFLSDSRILILKD